MRLVDTAVSLDRSGGRTMPAERAMAAVIWMIMSWGENWDGELLFGSVAATRVGKVARRRVLMAQLGGMRCFSVL